jgi:hypothetical protein
VEISSDCGKVSICFVKAGKYVANGAAIKGIIKKKYFCDF